MDKLNKKELMEVKAGGWGFGLLVIGAILLVVGIIDGYQNPKRCNCN